MTAIWVFILGAMCGFAAPFVWFAIDARRDKRRQRYEGDRGMFV